MTSKTTPKKLKGLHGRKADDYLELLYQHPLTSIKTPSQLKSAQQMIDLVLAKGKLSAGEETYLDTLSDLVASYEEQHYRIGPAPDSAMLEHLMDAKQVTQADVHRGTGISKSTLSEIINGKRKFTPRIICKLADYFKINKGILSGNLGE